MLELDHISTSAGAFRLNDIALTVKRGECHAVIGPSGSGKSTLLNAVLGTLPVSAGRIRLAGKDITRLPMEDRRIGYVPQNLGLFPHLSVQENLFYSARARRLPADRFRPLCDHLVEITGIGRLLNRKPATLSGGERQRVALVRALAADPGLVLLDEPFTALNESLRRELWWLVKNLQKERGLTVIIVTHDLSEAHFLSERMTVLLDGRQEQSGDTSSVYLRPASETVARFLGMKNLFPVRRVGAGMVDCPLLGKRVTIKDPVAWEDEALLAIRAEHVVLRLNGAAPSPDEVCFAGFFEEVLDLGDSVFLHFRTENGALLEARCGSRRLRTYGLKAGDAGMVGLPAKDMFIIPCTAPGVSEIPSRPVPRS